MKILKLILIIIVMFVNRLDAQLSSELNLPILLKTEKGVEIKSKAQWESLRRPEILALFAENVYGAIPNGQEVTIKSEVSSKIAMDGKAILKEITLNITRNDQAIKIMLTLFVPSAAKTPVPVFLLINNRGKENTDPTRKVKSEFWPAEELIEQGFAIAAFHYSDTAPDDALQYTHGVLSLYPELINQKSGMKAIAAWAWGASRIMDYFESEEAIDATKVALVGHSRGGKAALWCGANDQRFAITISNNSGCSGAALSRRRIGEKLVDINTRFPYWFCDNYQKYNEKENELPIDQHQLLALIAPRGLYVASASEDAWADPEGEFLALKYAEPAFKLYGIKGLNEVKQPAINSPIKSKNLGYHLRKGGHGLYLYDWQQYMAFAKGYFGR